ncbi:hypothetical protein FQZ97_1226440 [compost metagenome]
MLAAVGQAFYFLHGYVHLVGQQFDGRGGFANHPEAFAAGLVGCTCGFGGLRGVMRDIMGGGAHFLEGGSHLVDFAELLLHAGAGLAGDGGGLVGRAAGILHAAFDVGDDRLQFVEEAVEPAGQLA